MMLSGETPKTSLSEVQDLADKACRQIGEALPKHLRALAVNDASKAAWDEGLNLLVAVQATVGRALEQAAQTYGIRMHTKSQPGAEDCDHAWRAIRDGAGVGRLREVASATGVDAATLDHMRLVRQRLLDDASGPGAPSREALPFAWEGARGWLAAITWMEATKGTDEILGRQGNEEEVAP